MRLIAATLFLLAALSASSSSADAQLIDNIIEGCVPETEVNLETDYFPHKVRRKWRECQSGKRMIIVVSYFILTFLALHIPILQYKPPTIFTYNTDTDIYGEKFTPDNTTDLLTITYHNTYKIVTNLHQNVSYLLYQCGTIPPQDEIDSGKHHLVIPVPHTGGIVITQTTQVAPIELLGLRENIIAYIGNPDLISSPCMRYKMYNESEPSIQVLWNPDDPYNSTINDQLQADFVASHPDTLVISGPTDEPPYAARTINDAGTQERTNVATFDWIALYAALFNLEAMSNQISADTQARYDCTSTNAQLIVAQKGTADRRKRKLATSSAFVRKLESNATATASNDLASKHPNDIHILWATYFTGYNWSVADCSTWDNAFYCEYATHCGTNIISRPPEMGYFENYGGPTNYWYVNDDELLELGKDADIFIFPSDRWEDVYADKKAVLDQIKAVQTQQVYDTQGSGSNAWFEQRYAEYDVVGLDMCNLVGSNNPNVPHTRKWFRNIFTEPIGELPGCKIPQELDEPYIPRGADCELLTEEDFDEGGEVVYKDPTTTSTTPESAATATSVFQVMAMTSVLAVLIAAM